MRVFAAIPVPEPARTALAGIIGDLAAKAWPVRWVRPEGIHLTLKFFGAVAPEMTEQLIRALAIAAEGIGPVPLTCTSLGSFPSGSAARVVWIGVDAPGTLELLQDAVERACMPLGFPVEGRPFRPHITLGRVISPRKLPSEAFAQEMGPFDIPFLGEDVVLFHSRPGRGGSVYRSLHSIPLSPCAAV